MPCDPATIVNDARCIDKCIPPGLQLPVLISLFCQIVADGGGGGTGSQQVYSGRGDPGALVPANPAFSAIYTDFNTNQTWAWDPLVSLWRPADPQQVFQGATDPGAFTPAFLGRPALWTNTTTGALFSWVPATLSWI